MRCLTNPDGSFEQYDHEPNVAVARHWLAHGLEHDPATLEAKQAAGYRALDAMELHLEGRSFLVGERFTIADISLYAYTHVAGEGGFDLDRYPAIRTWLDRVAGQPGHVAIDA
jgi:glutathione S-transferase